MKTTSRYREPLLLIASLLTLAGPAGAGSPEGNSALRRASATLARWRLGAQLKLGWVQRSRWAPAKRLKRVPAEGKVHVKGRGPLLFVRAYVPESRDGQAGFRIVRLVGGVGHGIAADRSTDKMSSAVLAEALRVTIGESLARPAPETVLSGALQRLVNQRGVLGSGDPRVAARDQLVSGMIEALEDPFSYCGKREPGETGWQFQVVPGDGGDARVGPVSGWSPYSGTVRAGDRIIRVNGRRVRSVEHAAELLRTGRARIDVERGGKQLTFSLCKVSKHRLGDAVVLRIHDFEKGTAEAVRAEVARYADLPSVRFILDVRLNPGGLTTEVAEILRMFVGQQHLGGATQLFAAHRADGTVLAAYDLGSQDRLLAPDAPLAVLVNSTTCSSAEILAGVLQGCGRAKLFGTYTHGKGVCQERHQLPDDKTDIYLVAGTIRLPRPGGGERTYHGRGIEPDFYRNHSQSRVRSDGDDGLLSYAIKNLK